VPEEFAHLRGVSGVIYDPVFIPRKAKSFVFETSEWEVMNKKEYKASVKGRYSKAKRKGECTPN